MARPRALPRTLTAVLGALALAGALASPAGAAFGIAPEITAPATLTAGGHENVTLRIGIPGNGMSNPSDPQDIDVDLPPGLVGDPNAVTPCTIAQANAKNCPAASQVGVVTAVSDALIVTDMVTNGVIYVMEPRGDEPARLFIKLVPDSILWFTPQPIVTEAPLSLRSPGDFGLRNSIRDMPKTAVLYDNLGQSWSTIDIHLKQMTMTLYGTPPHSPKGPFLTNPTKCQPVVLEASARKYGSNDWVSGTSSEVPVTGCNSLPFDPSMSATPNTVTADQPTPLSVTLGFPAPSSNPADFGQSTVEKAQVVLPDGFGLSASSASRGLEGCTDAQFAADQASDPSCPAGSAIGTVDFTTPLVGTVSGTIFVGTPKPGATLRMLIYAELGNIKLKLAGRATPDPATGQLTTYFDEIPPIPFTAFKMSFRGGPNAILKAPPTCGDTNAVARLTPSARPGSAVEVQVPVSTTACVAPAFAPKLSASLASTQAGGDTGMTMSFERSDADERFDGLKSSLPPGLLGRLNAVERCAITDARAGSCPEGSRVGTVSVLAGTGPDPLPISGPVYFTEAIGGGVGGLAIIVPAAVGPIDLGFATVLAKMSVRPDLGIDVESAEPMPRMLGGVPLFVRSMTLKLDRDGFMFNASSCAEQQISVTLTSIAGSTSTKNEPYTPTGCESLPFAPKFSAVVSGPLKKPALTATMEPRPGDSTMASMKMMLPEGFGPDTAALRNTCQEADFVAGTCSAKAKIGSATALSSILPDPLSGDVYLVTLPGETLPGLAVTLKGLIDVPLIVRNSLGPGNRLISSVPAIPDVPLSRFELKISSLLTTDGESPCKSTPTIDATFTGHNGATYTSKPTVAVTCEARLFAPLGKLKVTGSVRKQGKRGGALRLTIRGKRMTGATVTVPNGLGLKAKAVRNDAVGKAGTSLLKRSMVTARGKKVTIKLPAAKTKEGVGVISLDLSSAAIRGKLRRGKKIVLKVRTTHTGGRASAATVKLKVR